LRTAKTVPKVLSRRGFELVETTIADIQQAYRSELLTPEQLVKMYQARIAAFDRAGPHLNGYMYVNPNAAHAARELMRSPTTTATVTSRCRCTACRSS